MSQPTFKERGLKRAGKPQTSKKGRRQQKSYMIRFWREAENGPWRVTLRSVAEGEPIHFADLEAFKEALATFLGEE